MVFALLHELGHATGRINADHGPYYDGDPTTEADWNLRIFMQCVNNDAVRTLCGDSTTW